MTDRSKPIAYIDPDGRVHAPEDVTVVRSPPCENCGGTGEIWHNEASAETVIPVILGECPVCKGTGHA